MRHYMSRKHHAAHDRDKKIEHIKDTNTGKMHKRMMTAEEKLALEVSLKRRYPYPEPKQSEQGWG